MSTSQSVPVTATVSEVTAKVTNTRGEGEEMTYQKPEILSSVVLTGSLEGHTRGSQRSKHDV